MCLLVHQIVVLIDLLGGQQQALIGIKIARMVPNASVVIVIPPTYLSVFKSHRLVRFLTAWRNMCSEMTVYRSDQC